MDVNLEILLFFKSLVNIAIINQTKVLVVVYGMFQVAIQVHNLIEFYGYPYREFFLCFIKNVYEKRRLLGV